MNEHVVSQFASDTYELERKKFVTSFSKKLYEMKSFQPVDKQRFTMLLAPFQPMIKIELKAYLNTSVECYLDIKNPSDKTLCVTVTKVPDIKRQIILNADNLAIPGISSSTISIKWSPKEAGCWRDVLQLTDNRRIKYDIAIMTTAKTANKEKMQKRLPKRATLSKSSFSVRTVNKLCQDTSLNIPSSGGQSSFINNKQMRGDEPRRVNISNKENIMSEYHKVKIYTSREEDKSTKPHCGYQEPTSVLSEQQLNVWSDGSVLPQTFLTSNVPQEIRRATYVKKRHWNGTTTIYERSEQVTEDVVCMGDRSGSNFSMLINELKITPTNISTVSPRPAKKESTEFTNSLSVESAHEEKNKTFAVDHRTFEVSAISVVDIVLSPVARPLEYCELSFKDGASNLIASSPISQRSHYDVPKLNPEIERSECFLDSMDHSGRVDREYFNCATIPEDIETSNRAGDVYIEISPPIKNHSKPSAPLFNTKTGRVTKEKNLCNGGSVKGHHRLFVPVAPRKNTRKNLSTIMINKSAHCTLRGMKCTQSTTRKVKPQIKEISIYEVFMPNPFTSSMTENPFLKNMASVFSEKWLLRQELVFTLWLNTVLSTPKDLRVNIDNVITDNIDKWQSRKDGVDVSAPAQGTQGIAFTSCYTATKLHALRKDAYAMLCRAEVAEVKSRINSCVTEGMLYIRLDRDLHRDLSLQKDVLNVFLCYNPLWLRIGLEAVYNESIPLRNNNDLFGLTRFLMERFFTNPQLAKTPGYHRADPSKKFLKALNQFMLKKFLLLVYFLDYAKQHKLIAHDPCLFRKQAAWKTSREILLRFSRDLLAEVGDVTKVLRGYNYVLTHQQTYIDEYEYEVTDIRQDLRDGVRLCRVVELIAGVDGLTRQCRAPAISLLQKVHNVELALDALRQAGGVLADDVEAKSIARGDRTKTLSLLWQIVHKIQAPRFDRAVQVIQRWWRSRVWHVRVKNYLHARRDHAAIVIQRAWRSRNCKTEITEERVSFLRVKKAVIHLQRWWKRARENAQVKKRCELEDKHRRAVLVLQRRWRATLLMRAHRERYRALRKAASTIQTRWRRMKRAAELRRAELLRAREGAAVRIQSWWRSSRLTREKRQWFLRCRTSALLIQKTWRMYQARDRERRDACLRIQTWWRAASCSRRYQLQKSSCMKLQRWWRERQRHLLRRRAVSLIESWFLRVKAGRTAREAYLGMREAAIQVQTWWRAVSLAREEQQRYRQLRRSAVILQTLWRRHVLARQDRQRFLAKRTACVTLQSSWRMIQVRRCYERRRRRVIALQRRWRAILAGRLVRKEYEDTGTCVIALQRRWRAILAGRLARKEYEDTRACVIALQRRWRAILADRLVKKEYEDTRTRIIVVQTRWRAFVTRRRFLRCRQAAIVIQSYYRMKLAKRQFENAKRAALMIQLCWRRYRRKKIDETKALKQQDLAFIVMGIQDECKNIRADQEGVDGNFKLPNSEYWQQTIDILHTCNNVGALLTCLSSLDTITKLSPTICVILCQLNLVDEIYKTISQRNRSQPWMIVCQRVCSILITLAKYPYTRKYIVKQEHALLLVKLLNDTLKDKEVFLHCATLIWLLSQDKDYSKAMTTRLEISWLLRNIQQKVSKATAVANLHKSRKLEKLCSTCKSDQGSTLQFTDINAAILAIINRINSC